MSRQTLSRADTLVTAKLAESHHLSFILAEDLDLVSHQSLTRKLTCMDSEKEKKHAFSFSFSQYCIRIDQLYRNGVAEQVCSVLPRPQSTSLILLLQVSEATVDRTRHLSDIWELWRVIQKLTASPAASSNRILSFFHPLSHLSVLVRYPGLELASRKGAENIEKQLRITMFKKD